MSSAMLRFPEIDLAYALVVGDLVGRSLDEHRSADENRDALGKAKYEMHVVLDENDRHLARQLSDHSEELRAFGGRYAGGRIVEQQHRGSRRERQGYFPQSLLSVRQRARRRIGIGVEP